MAIDFGSIAHQFVYEKIRSYLRELYGKFGRHESEPSFLITREEGEHAHVIVNSFRQVDGIVRVLVLIETGVDTNNIGLLRYLLEKNSELDVGAFGLDENGNIFLDHCILGTFCDKGQLHSAVMLMLDIATATREEISRHINNPELAPAAPAASAVEPAEAEAKPAATRRKRARVAEEVAPAAKPAGVSWRDKIDRIELDHFGIYYCIRGLPISLNDVLTLLDEGKTDDEIFDEYPDLEDEDLEEIRRYGVAIRAEFPDPEPEPEPEPKPAPVAKSAPRRSASPAPARPAVPKRLRLDDFGIYYCIRGLPISVTEVLTLIESGKSDAEVLAEYPSLNAADLEEVKIFGPDLREKVAPEPEEAPKPKPKPAFKPSPKPSKPSKPPVPKKRVLRRIRPDALGIYHCIRGLPISVDEITEHMAKGRTDEEILSEYPRLVKEDLEEVRIFNERQAAGE